MCIFQCIINILDGSHHSAIRRKGKIMVYKLTVMFSHTHASSCPIGLIISLWVKVIPNYWVRMSEWVSTEGDKGMGKEREKENTRQA